MECEKYAEKREEKYETSEEAEGTFFYALSGRTRTQKWLGKRQHDHLMSHPRDDCDYEHIFVVARVMARPRQHSKRQTMWIHNRNF